MPDHDGPPLPHRLSEITPAWLTAALRHGGRLPDGAVSRVALELIGADRGFTGVVARVRPTYRDLPPGSGPPPESVIAKLPTAEPDTPSAYRRRSQQDAAAAARHYQRCAREVSFYRELAPALGAGAPRLYHAGVDPQRQQVVLLLEDLAGGKPGDALTGGTADQVGAVLAAVAPVHAAGWEREPAGWVPRLAVDPLSGQRWYAERADRFLAGHADRVPAPVAELVDRLRGDYADVLVELARAPATIVHGDLHLDNVIFDPPGRPVAVLDWQGIGYGPVALDVADTVYGSLPVADRRAAEQTLLERHAAALTEAGVPDYPVELLRRDCRLVLLRMLAFRVAWLASVDPDTLAGRERALVEAALGDGRLVGALQDHGLA
ncbi:MAG: phosphotransferase [Micromonosporaceae bacterium]|nr:phosphotransferase [Micromonosporaceae bacterium]